MANLLCESTIDFTASSWKVLDSATNSYSNSEASTVLTGTSYVGATTAITPGAITVEGILIKVKYRNGSAVGTLSCELYNNTLAASVSGTEVTITVADILQTLTTTGGGWVYFKFSAPVTLLAANAYVPRIKTSVGSSVGIYVSASNNWSRALVTSTTAAPASSDNLISAAPFTSTSTPSVITLSIDNTATTVFGSFSNGAYSSVVCKNAASTAYKLYIADGGYILNTLGASFDISGMPTTTSFFLNLQAASATNNGIFNRSPSTLKLKGTVKTRMAKLAANSSAAATSLTTDISTGWKNGDQIVFANTTKSGSPLVEIKALTADASGTSLTITAMTSAKSGVAPVQCDIGNVTSNLKIAGSSTTNTCFIYNNYSENFPTVSSTGVGKAYMEIDNCEFQYFGGSAVYKYGIVMFGQGGSTNIVTNNGFYDLNTNTRCLYNNGTIDHHVVNGNVVYGGAFGVDFVSPAGVTSGTLQLNGNLFIGQNTNGLIVGRGVPFDGDYQEVKNNIASGQTQTAIYFIWNNNTGVTVDGNIAYGCATIGQTVAGSKFGIKNSTAYLNNQHGMNLTGSDVTVDTLTAFSNTTSGLINSGGGGFVVVKSATINAGSAAQPYGFYINSGLTSYTYFSNCSLGVTTPHGSGDIFVAATFGGILAARNSSFGSTTIVASQTNLTSLGRIGMQKFGGTYGSNRTYFQRGRVDADSTIFDSSPRSMRLTPSSATISQQVPAFMINIPSGSTATITCKIRKSVFGDGAAYNGTAQPKIILRSNAAAGSSFNNDITAMTATNAANGAWETLSYTTPTASDDTALEFVLEAIGSAGWVNLDTITVT